MIGVDAAQLWNFLTPAVVFSASSVSRKQLALCSVSLVANQHTKVYPIDHLHWTIKTTSWRMDVALVPWRYAVFTFH
jgi:hypothetical protein